MKLDDLTVKEVREIQRLFASDNAVVKRHPFNVGDNYFIRTVTMSLMGKLVAVYDTELVLVDCTWVADTGRFSDFLKGKKDSSLELEPFPNEQEVIVGRGSIIDATLWMKDLYREQK